MDVFKEAKAIKDKLVKIRRQLHMYPEIGFKEFKTQKFIIGELKKLKIPFKVMAGTGVVGVVKGCRPGKTIAVRADIDALPITEENNKPYKSRNKGMMHACGHDNNTTCLLGVAMLLSKMKKSAANFRSPRASSRYSTRTTWSTSWSLRVTRTL